MATQRKTNKVVAKKAAPVAKKANVVRLPVTRPVMSPSNPVNKLIADKAPGCPPDRQAGREFPGSPEDRLRGWRLCRLPGHGVGRVERVETISIAGIPVTTYVIHFENERMTLKVPVSKARTAGLRKLSSRDRIKSALETLTGKAQIRRVMWSRRAQEYEAKINSGDPARHR